MGVTDLWQIIEPVREHVHLQSLGGKTLAVDLSLWVCEAQSVKGMIGVVSKPYLRNLFFRVSSLNLLGVKLVFVVEGEAPKLKAKKMSMRHEMRFGPSIKSCSATARTGRSCFKVILRECCELLDCLGIPWVQAAGEAEAMCAYLNANGYVDGCITNDGDVFLYGAQTVYRNFTMNTKDPHVDCYRMPSVKLKLGLDRDALVGLAVLLGCDYLPKGVPGVGKEQAIKLIEHLKGQSLLKRFRMWKEQFKNSSLPSSQVKKTSHCPVCQHPGLAKDHERMGCRFCESTRFCEPHDYDYCCPCEWHQAEREKQANSAEYNIKKKARACEGFPFDEVLKEFLITKDKPVMILQWKRPRLLLLQNFAFCKMEWPKHYTCEKALPLLTYFDMVERKMGKKDSSQLQAQRILKTRVRHGVLCFEVMWQKPDYYVYSDSLPKDCQDSVTTVEEQLLFEASYPDIVVTFQKEKADAETKKMTSKHSKSKPAQSQDPDDAVALLLSQMNLNAASENCSVDYSCAIDYCCETVSLQLSALKSSAVQPRPASSCKDKPFQDNTDKYCNKPELSTSDYYSASSQDQDFLSETSPNVSAIVSELNLSAIDWESTSFSTPLSTSSQNSVTSERSLTEVLHPKNSQPQQVVSNTIGCTSTVSSKLASLSSQPHYNEDCYDYHLLPSAKTLPLKEQLLWKNSSELRSQNQIDLSDTDYSDRTELFCVAEKGDGKSSTKSQSSPAKQTCSIKLIPSNSQKVQDTAPECACLKSVFSDLNQKCPPPKVKFGSTQKDYFSERMADPAAVISKLRMLKEKHSNTLDVNLELVCKQPKAIIHDYNEKQVKNESKAVIKRSVCYKCDPFSDDSDTENICHVMQEQLNKKIKQKGTSLFSDKSCPANAKTDQRALKHLHKIEDSEKIINTYSEFKNDCLTVKLADLSEKNRTGSSENNHVQTFNFRSEGLPSSYFQNNLKVLQSDTDDSDAPDSPLPLSERLKLKFQH
ncbi:flap endonuclease GEN homolog 1 isoform X2 [Protopterus annectens]|uniref:flap endonuclease GEN homolog 1 isoform X2 n=1 Tax=Protopterus annectens TaxID=7888 RepID=UPI001CFBE8F5|nr:flap endonuclease GEN homolog 1 isoform X2 [Protopterus annectens]